MTALHRSRRARGLSYVEVMISVFLLSIALAPALQAVTAGVQGARIHADLSPGMSPVEGEIREILARPYPVLYRAAIAGGSAGGNPSVPIAPYDPTVALGSPLPATIPAGPGFSDANYDVYIHSVDPVGGAAASSDSGLLQIRMQPKNGSAGIIAFKARVEVYD